MMSQTCSKTQSPLCLAWAVLHRLTSHLTSAGQWGKDPCLALAAPRHFGGPQMRYDALFALSGRCQIAWPSQTFPATRLVEKDGIWIDRSASRRRLINYVDLCMQRIVRRGPGERDLTLPPCRACHSHAACNLIICVVYGKKTGRTSSLRSSGSYLCRTEF